MSLEIRLDPLQVLPQEVCVKIFGNLKKQDLKNCLQVSKCWNEVLSTNDYWNEILEFQGLHPFEEVEDEISKKRVFDALYKEYQVINWDSFHRQVGDIVKANRDRDIVIKVGFLYSQALKFELEIFSNNREAFKKKEPKHFIFFSNHKEKALNYVLHSHGDNELNFSYNLNVKLPVEEELSEEFIDKKTRFMNKYFFRSHSTFTIEDKLVTGDQGVFAKEFAFFSYSSLSRSS